MLIVEGVVPVFGFTLSQVESELAWKFKAEPLLVIATGCDDGCAPPCVNENASDPTLGCSEGGDTASET
jgi:hypothetical protein